MLRLCRRKEVEVVQAARRSTLEVALELVDKLETLEAEKVALEKKKAKASNPINLALGIAIAQVAAQIATITHAIRSRKRRHK